MFTGAQVWPQAWWREGGAEWVQNASIYFKDYERYKNYLKDDCSFSCKPLSELEIAEFLTSASENFLPSKFDPWLNYALGSHIVEILVAIKGPDVLIDMYAEMGKGQSFSNAFKSFFGIAWKDAIPLLAKSVYTDLHS